MDNPLGDGELLVLRRKAKLASKGLCECGRCNKTVAMESALMLALRNLPLGALCMDCANSCILAGTAEAGQVHVRLIRKDDLTGGRVVAARDVAAPGERRPILAPNVQKAGE